MAAGAAAVEAGLSECRGCRLGLDIEKESRRGFRQHPPLFPRAVSAPAASPDAGEHGLERPSSRCIERVILDGEPQVFDALGESTGTRQRRTQRRPRRRDLGAALCGERVGGEFTGQFGQDRGHTALEERQLGDVLGGRIVGVVIARSFPTHPQIVEAHRVGDRLPLGFGECGMLVEVGEHPAESGDGLGGPPEGGERPGMPGGTEPVAFCCRGRQMRFGRGRCIHEKRPGSVAVAGFFEILHEAGIGIGTGQRRPLPQSTGQGEPGRRSRSPRRPLLHLFPALTTDIECLLDEPVEGIPTHSLACPSRHRPPQFLANKNPLHHVLKIGVGVRSVLALRFEVVPDFGVVGFLEKHRARGSGLEGPEVALASHHMVEHQVRPPQTCTVLLVEDARCDEHPIPLCE